MVIDFNGHLVPPEAVRIDPFDRGFTLGDGIFESLRVTGGQVEFAEEHLDRLNRAAEVTAMPLPFTRSEILVRMVRLIAATEMADAALRLMVSRGPAARGVAAPPPEDCRPTVVMALHPLPPTRNAAVAAVVATVTRRNEFSPFSRVKAAPYLDSIVALEEAKGKDAQDAVLLNTQGRVASACYANLFAVIGGRLVTPPLADGPLPGVTRGRVLAALDGAEEGMSADDLAGAEEIFLTNSFGIRSVTALDGRPLPEGPMAAKAREIAG
ncbi:MAG TPA: 2-keto-4-methylthiobutyrate aminotransferase [Rhodospirillaceae bacterium]|nr:2-keto-4-methylthiobutyrate aminotransferase [Rhodospirillaceae bacterium]|tara:strand:+ start:461 stop:1264 length:804 start_codon:yes stop_codon:yes gene_type:complete